MSNVNVKRLVENIRSGTNVYTPLVELVVNAIQAIDEKKITNGLVEIEVIRNGQADIIDRLEDVDGFIVKDNGIGFTKDNRDSFDTLYTEQKIVDGGKGFGRFTCLKYFDRVKVSSTFEDGGAFRDRTFGMGLGKDIIVDEKVAASQKRESGSVVEISGIKSVRFPDKRLDIISRVVVERLLPYFVDRDRTCPRIVIRDAKSPAMPPLSLNDYLGKDDSQIVEMNVDEGTFTLSTNDEQKVFQVRVFKFFSPRSAKSKVSLVAHRREVTDNPLQAYVPEFAEEFYEPGPDQDLAKGRNFVIKAYVFGDYLNDNVSLERGEFRFQTDSDLLNGISQTDIEQRAAEIAQTSVGAEIAARKQRKQARIAEYVETNPVTNAIFNSAGYTPGEVAVAFREGAGEASGFNETWSTFANGELDLGGGFKVNAGVRGGIDHGELDGCSTDYNGNYLPIVNTAGRAIIYQTYGVLAPMVVKNGCTTYDPATNTDHRVHSSLDQGNFSGRFALNYRPSDTTLLYASIARGVKSGVIPIVPANRAVQFTPAKQEKLTAYEAGIKTAIGGRLAQLNVSGFYYDYTDKQFSSYVPDPTFGALQRLVNIPSSHAWGIDGEVTLRPDPALTLVWNAVYLKTKVEDYVGANAAGIPTDFSGSEFSYAPEFSTSGTAMLNLPITSGLNLQATGNVTYQTSTHSDFGEDPLFRLKCYALVNGSIGVASRDGRWSLNLWARNLTNEYYWTSVVDNQNLNVRFAGRPRTFGMSLTAGF